MSRLFLLYVDCQLFKERLSIYKNPFGLLGLTLSNYKYVIENSSFFTYFRNSFLVVVISLFSSCSCSLAAYALAHWRSKASRAIYFFVIGMMLPIKIATIRLMELVRVLGV